MVILPSCALYDQPSPLASVPSTTLSPFIHSVTHERSSLLRSHLG